MPTVAPRSARIGASAAPMPDDAPVKRIFEPSSFMRSFSGCADGVATAFVDRGEQVVGGDAHRRVGLVHAVGLPYFRDPGAQRRSVAGGRADERGPTLSSVSGGDDVHVAGHHHGDDRSDRVDGDTRHRELLALLVAEADAGCPRGASARNRSDEMRRTESSVAMRLRDLGQRALLDVGERCRL